MKKKKVSGILYDITRACGKIASSIYDIEVISSKDTKKITKRFIKKKLRKKINKETNKILNKL